MKNFLIIGLLLTATVALAGKTGDDVWQIGNPTSGGNKKLLFDTGDGATNKYFLLDNGTKKLSTNVDELKIGSGAAANQSIILNRGGSNPVIRWNETNSVLEFSNDGTSFLNVGSGSGGGGGGLSILATNPDFEQSLALGWTATGLSFTAVTTGGNLLFGKQSALIDSSATSQSLKSDAYLIPIGLRGKNCGAQVYYLGGDSTYKLQALDGSDVLIHEQVFPGAALTVSPMTINFICPSSGSLKLAIVSTANGAAMAIDRTSIGEAGNLFQVSQGKFIGEAFIDNPNCAWNNAGTGLVTMATDSDCLAPQVVSNPGPGTFDTTTVTNLPKFTLKNLPPGQYQVLVKATAGVGGGNASMAISDGTTISGKIGYDTTTHSNYTMVGNFNYTSPGDRTFEVVGGVSGFSTTLYGDSGVHPGWILDISVYRYPGPDELAYKPDLVEWHVDANIGGDNPSLTGTTATYTEITASSFDIVQNPGSLAVQIPCSSTNPSTGLTCSAGSEGMGVVFDLPRAGSVEVCIDFTSHATAGTNQTNNIAYQVVETPNNAQTILQEGKSRLFTQVNHGPAGNNITIGEQVKACGTFEFTSPGQKTFRLMYESNSLSTGFSIVGDRDASTGQRDIHVTARPVNQSFPMPVILNSVVTPVPAVTNFVSAHMDSGGSFVDGTTSWISCSGAGSYSCTINAGVFSGTPNCVCSEDETSVVATNRMCGVANVTSTSLNVHLINHLNSFSAVAFQIMCMGPK